jgi:hypothetical protein
LNADKVEKAANGNVGLGVQPIPSQGVSFQLGLAGVLEHEPINTNDLRTNLTSNALSITPYSNSYRYLSTGASASMLQQTGGEFRFFSAPVGTAGAIIPFSERARIDSSGRLLIGTATNTGGALFQVNGDRIRVGTARTPASASATGAIGEICWDANYVYVCTATNTWKRSALSAW